MPWTLPPSQRPFSGTGPPNNVFFLRQPVPPTISHFATTPTVTPVSSVVRPTPDIGNPMNLLQAAGAPETLSLNGKVLTNYTILWDASVSVYNKFYQKNTLLKTFLPNIQSDIANLPKTLPRQLDASQQLVVYPGDPCTSSAPQCFCAAGACITQMCLYLFHLKKKKRKTCMRRSSSIWKLQLLTAVKKSNDWWQYELSSNYNIQLVQYNLTYRVGQKISKRCLFCIGCLRRTLLLNLLFCNSVKGDITASKPTATGDLFSQNAQRQPFPSTSYCAPRFKRKLRPGHVVSDGGILSSSDESSG